MDLYLLRSLASDKKTYYLIQYITIFFIEICTDVSFIVNLKNYNCCLVLVSNERNWISASIKSGVGTSAALQLPTTGK